MNAPAFLARFAAMDRALVAAGFPATSPWWRAQIERFFRSGRRRWIIRAGRRAGKSSTLCRLAVAWALWGTWSVPPGDTAVIPFVSVDRNEASARLRTIADILRTLGVQFEQRSDEIELMIKRPDQHEQRLVFRVVTCSITGTVGFTGVATFADEQARWESRDTAANPAREVMASLRPTMATQPFAFEVNSSSPWGTEDYHAEQFKAGDTDQQITSFAPTWIANPTISEARTHELEPDARVHAREYAAEPGATLSAAFDVLDLATCYGRRPSGSVLGGFVAIDASSLRGDAFTWLAGHETDLGEIVIHELGGWEDAELREVSMRDICEAVAERARAYGTSKVYGDQREEAALRALFQDQFVELKSFAWSEPSKDDAIVLLRRLMREGKLFLPEHEKLRKQLAGMKARMLPSGRTRYETNGLDYASALITLAHASVANELNSYNPMLAALSRVVKERKACGGSFDLGAHHRGFSLL